MTKSAAVYAAQAAIYARISKVPTNSLSATLSDGETSYSVEDQEDRCLALCSAAGYQVGATFYDDGISAYRSLKDRPGYSDLKKAIAEKKFDVLVFDRQDRLARDQIETLDLIVASARAGITWHSVDEGPLDLSNPMHLLMTIFRGGEAEGYSRKISENQKRSNASKREKGLPGAGPRPFGFEEDKITPRPDEAALVKLGTEMALAGKKIYEIRAAFIESGITPANGTSPWHPATIRSLLTRWRNAGWVEHAREPYGPAVWPPIIADDRDTAFQMVKEVRAIFNPNPGGPVGEWRKPTHLISGIAECWCGSQLIASKSVGHPIYRCIQQVYAGKGNASGHSSIFATVIEPQVIDALLNLYLHTPQADSVSQSSNDTLAQLHENLSDARTKLSRLTELYTEGDITKAEYAKRSAKYRGRVEELEQGITDLVRQSAHSAMLLEARQMLVEGPEHKVSIAGAAADKKALRDRFDALSLEDQRKLIAAALTIKVYPGRAKDRVEIVPL